MLLICGKQLITKISIDVGRFKNDKYHGQGTYTGADGRRYVGEWKDDKFHGRGTFNYPDGRVEEGIWKYGRLVK